MADAPPLTRDCWRLVAVYLSPVELVALCFSWGGEEEEKERWPISGLSPQEVLQLLHAPGQMLGTTPVLSDKAFEAIISASPPDEAQILIITYKFRNEIER